MSGVALRYLLFAPWIVFAVVWIVGTFSAKRTVKAEGTRSYFSHNVFLVMGAMLLFGWPKALVGERLWRDSPGIEWIALALTALGIGFTIWSRVVIAGNWSANVTIKEGHDLATSGPYRVVRHPIYTGLLIALAGEAIAVGSLGAMISLPLFVLGLWLKLRIEERFLREQFGAAYDAYARRSKALIPFIW